MTNASGSGQGTRATGHIFISHASADDAFVKELRQALEASDHLVWVDSRNLRGGSKLAREVEQAIQDAAKVIAVLSLNTVNSRWVRREIEKALEVEKRRKPDGYSVVPLLLPGIEPAALEGWFDEEPVGVRVKTGPGGLADAMPAILAALEKRLPTEQEAAAQPEAGRLDELVLTLSGPKIKARKGTRRATATATLEYEPADRTARGAKSQPFEFTAPVGPIELDNLRWYLEDYHIWPLGVFQSRAKAIQDKLPEWGQALFEAALGAGAEGAADAIANWRRGEPTERRFSVEVDSSVKKGSSEKAQAAAREAATDLLALPWELLHDGHAWLFQGKHAVRVRRRLPSREGEPSLATALPIRVLFVCPRPEHDGKGNRVGYVDHRGSARALVDAVEGLGNLVRLTFLTPPTYLALDEALQAAADRQAPFDIVHFHGHGVYDKRLGLGGLCFEDPKDGSLLENRTMEFIDAAKLAGLFRHHRIPLVFLEACQTAVAEVDPTASVAARLLEEGVTSVVAMSHSVLVETARRFVQAFYGELAKGRRVGAAMLAGQRALHDDTWRGKVMAAGELRLQDWFVPVLYQEKQDPQLITKTPARDVQHLEAQKRKLSLGDLPGEPAHKFQGRSRELLALERLLHGQPWAVVRGTGGAGKTTLAAEMARWLTRTGRFERAAFVNLDKHRDDRAALDAIGHQLLPGGQQTYSVAQFRDLDQALQPVELALRDHPTILLLDNCESILDSPSSSPPSGDHQPSARHGASSTIDHQPSARHGASSTIDHQPSVFSLCQRLLAADPRTRLVFTTRSPLPAPFDHRGRERELGALDRTDAIELVSEVMKQNGWTPPATDPGSTPAEIRDLVEAVNCHARALVLLAREVAQRGVRATTENLRSLMADLERKHPGDRENSLYASVELSLRRLSPESRQRIKVLAVCQGGVQINVWAEFAGIKVDEARRLAIELIEVGLGEDMGYGHLRLDPGLPPYLLGEMAADEAAAMRAKWAEAMAQLTGYLYEEWFKDTQLAAHLTRLELPNLLAMLEWVAAPQSPAGEAGRRAEAAPDWRPERVVELASGVERLVAELGRPQALSVATGVREQAAQRLGDWSHARFTTESATIDRLLERGDLPAALDAAQQLLQRCRAAGETAYPEAAYDLAMAHARLGRVFNMGGAAEAALQPLAEAQRRVQHLADAGDADAERMAAVAITETGDCLRGLGRLDAAAAAYEESIKRADKLKDRRQVAVNKFQLGTVRMLQERYDEALRAHAEARDTFAALGEPRHVATAWHQIGMVHEEAGQFEPAEQAYRQSLAIKVRENDLDGQASSLNQLGLVYDAMGRSEEAVTFLRQSAEIYTRLNDQGKEGMARSNLAIRLTKLRRYDEARQELQRAIECGKPYGHAAEPWKTWGTLETLERATNHAEAALAARQQALQTYLAYRRAGGVSQSPRAHLFDLVAQAIQQNQTRAASDPLTQLASHPQAPPFVKALIAKLQAVLAGDRSPALAADPELTYRDAAELELLLEKLRA